jgi:hypothetical protein
MAERPDDAHEAPDGLPDPDNSDGLPRASNDAHHDHRADDDGLVSDTSHRYPEPSSDDVADDPHRHRNGVSPLLTLELTTIEKTAETSTSAKDSNPPHMRAPLLGTSHHDIIVNVRKSSTRRSPTRVCYTELLHNRGHNSSSGRRKSTVNGRNDCYSTIICLIP